MNRSTALTWASRQLNSSTSPALDAEVLLASVLNLSRTKLLTDLNQNINLFDFWRLKYVINKRTKGMPVAYLTHNKEFYGRKFLVNKHTLIPRPETELLIEKTIGTIRANGSIKTVADIGTGSGCLAITLALELPLIKITATDISPSAIKVARRNACVYKVANRIDFKHGDLLSPLKSEKIDLIIANLPYVKKTEYDANPELKYEPASALLEQPGLFEKFCQQIAQNTKIEFILLETSPLVLSFWLETIKKILPHCLISVFSDLSGNSRLIMIDK
ncbi:MAG: peptide chain release factor N(5)-glutamine methyltransferase [Patescibacteria group bacterium]